MAFAGTWESWKGPKAAPLDEPLVPYTVATAAANAAVAPVHPRMPVLVADKTAWDAWLDPAAPAELLADTLLKPATDDLLKG